MKGRKPTPTVLRMLRGNAGKRPLPQNEPVLPLVTPEPPTFFGPEARAEWDRIVPTLVQGGMLTAADRAGLIVYCLAFGRVAKAEASVLTQGELVKAPSGYPIQNPNLNISKGWVEILARMIPEYGMTPSSRSRVAAAGVKPKGSKLDRFTGTG